MFHPGTFWHTPDWESSTPRPRQGYVEDKVLYVGDFEEISIHLFPRVRVIRVRAQDASDASLSQITGYSLPDDKRANIFIARDRQQSIQQFEPTIYRFDRTTFKNLRRGEYVSYQPCKAIDSLTIALIDAIELWNLHVCFVESLDTVKEQLADADIYFDEQT